MLLNAFLEDDHWQTKKAPKLLKDRYMLESLVFAFPRNHFLFEVFDRKLQQYIEGDLINYNTREWQESINRKTFQHKEPFAVLTFGELEAGFVVCLVPLILSGFVFCIEWLITLKNLLVFIIIFKKLFEEKYLEQKKHSNAMRIKFNDWQQTQLEKLALHSAKKTSES